MREALEREAAERAIREKEERKVAAEEARRRAEEEATKAALEEAAKGDQYVEKYDCAKAQQWVKRHTNPDKPMYRANADGTFTRSTPEEIEGIRKAWEAIANRLCPRAEPEESS